MPAKANRTITPGAFDPAATREQVCMSSYATHRRPSRWQALKLKRQALKAYGLSPLNPLNWHGYRLDHLVPLELGGMPLDLRNVWPQPRAEAALKDRDEGAQHRAVCRGDVTLADAQQEMISTWSE